MTKANSKPAWNRKVDDDVLVESYARLQNVWKVAEEVGLCGQTVHARLTRIGKINRMNYWTEKDDEFLLANYAEYRDDWRLSDLSKIMGRTEQFISRKAGRLGLTDIHTSPPKRVRVVQGEKRRTWLENNDHPRGMLGKKHTEETKNGYSKMLKKRWKDPSSYLNSEEYRQKQSDTMSKLQASGKLNNNYSRAKSGWFVIGGKKHFYRSSWEVDIASYYEFLKTKKEIKEWEYEADVFWFDKIKRGVRSYKPDFKITNNDDSVYYVEVKGWMDAKSKTKIKRMAIYHPSVKLEIIDQNRYYAIRKNASIIPGWGAMDMGLKIEEKKCKIDGCENKSHCKDMCRKHYYKIYKK